ncbi:MAG: putative peptidoglycan glycosyltransferase FtsW [Chthoniobacter sp.]|uniref:FtsW/RodA/SpoVE family cell cycle protein n=1 Tax=Chthoniobacter sp. TaxID=2510640 RepID=UPI0032AAFA5A
MNAHRTSVYLLVVTVIGLIVLGLVMLSSTSAYAPESHGSAMFLLKRQVVWLGIGMVVCAMAAALDYHHLQKTWWIWFLLSVFLLALCFVPHICHRINGSRRWINIGVTFQPSEFAKLAAVVTVAWWFARDEAYSRQFLRGFVAPLVASGVLMGLIAPEVDMGTTALIGTTTFLLMFIAGTRLVYLVPTVASGFVALIFVALKMPQRFGRMMAFMYPEKYPTEAYQTVQGLIALGSGGVEGLGLGNGRQKMMYLPFAHTDFIFPVVGEELGLRITLVVVFTYIVFILCGAIIAMRARDRFGMLLGFGIVVIIALQAAVNIGVTTALLPNKGLPLPFISYGGSNLVFCLLGVGILINIYRQGLNEQDDQKNSVVMRARTRNARRVVRL